MLRTFFMAVVLLPVASLAAERTVLLNIPTMDCASCPVTIRFALLKVAGVSRATVSYRNREARVTFDDARTSVQVLRATTQNVGYPSFVK